MDASIRNVVFDLGGVILNLAPHKTMEAFASIAGQPVEEVLKTYHERPEFNAYEKGKMGDEEFRAALRRIFATQASDATLDTAWNAMLLDIPSERLRLLERVKKSHRTFLLSNTNAIHVEHFNKMLQSVHQSANLEPFFHKTYFSHVVKMRKPDHEIYHHVLNDNSLNPAETIFLDDNLSNLQGAREVGIQTFHVAHPDLIFTLFK